MKDLSWIPALITALGSLLALYLSSRKDADQHQEDTEKYLRQQIADLEKRLHNLQADADKLRDKVNDLKVDNVRLKIEVEKLRGEQVGD